MGNYVAPRPNSQEEFFKVLHSGLGEKALAMVKMKSHHYNIDLIDASCGLSALHLACAHGLLEVVLELLTQGARVNTPDINGGNFPLHYAAKNQHKYVVEILLRWGADPSLPNNDGILPVELVSESNIRELFLRDRSGIFSPVMQARTLLQEKIHTEQTKNSQEIAATDIQPVEILSFQSSTKQQNSNYTLVPVVPTISSASAKSLQDELNANSRLQGISSNIRSHNASTIYSSPVPSAQSQISPQPAIFLSPATPLPSTAGYSQLFSSPTTATKNFAVNSVFDLQAESAVREGVARASEETALVYHLPSEIFEMRRQLVSICFNSTFDEKRRQKLESLLEQDPTLPMARLVDLGGMAADGQTPLHVVCGRGQTAVLDIFIKYGQGLSFWVRDLQGRTPLHLAARSQLPEMCKLLRRLMRREVESSSTCNVDPVGKHAPIDMAGTTPLGWAKLGAKDLPKDGEKAILAHERLERVRAELLSPGDRSVLPITPYVSRSGKTASSGLVFGFAEAQGWCPYMEDRICLCPSLQSRPSWSLFALFDGHGGTTVSAHLASVLPGLLEQELAVLDISADEAEDDEHTMQTLLERVCFNAEQSLQSISKLKVKATTSEKGTSFKSMDSSGSTGVILLITPHSVVVANVGDSRAVLVRSARDLNSNCSNLEALAMTTDHKPSIPAERERIEAAGGLITQINGSDYIYVPQAPNCKLSVSRAFGDLLMKQNAELPFNLQAIASIPDVRLFRRNNGEVFVVLACDGVWDVLSSEELIQIVQSQLHLDPGKSKTINAGEVARACDCILNECLQRKSSDNMSIVIIMLPTTVLTATGDVPTEDQKKPFFPTKDREGSLQADIIINRPSISVSHESQAHNSPPPLQVLPSLSSSPIAPLHEQFLTEDDSIHSPGEPDLSPLNLAPSAVSKRLDF